MSHLPVWLDVAVTVYRSEQAARWERLACARSGAVARLPASLLGLLPAPSGGSKTLTPRPPVAEDGSRRPGAGTGRPAQPPTAPIHEEAHARLVAVPASRS